MTIPLPASPPDHQSFSPQIALYVDTMLNALITAGRARVYFSQRYTFLDQSVQVKFFHPNGELHSTLYADSIAIDDNTHHMMAAGSVQVIATNPPTTLLTNRLFWDDANRLLYTPDSVILTTQTETIYGIGFESDERLQNYSFHKVRMIITNAETLTE